MEKVLFNTYSDNWCGYCAYHDCAVTVKQLRAKGCLQKECWHLVRREEHPYWKQREIMKQKRKARKLALQA